MIKKEEVRRVANLARLGISPAEEERFQKDLSAVLDYFKSLDEVDTSQILPTFQPTEALIKEENRTREDEAQVQEQGLAKKLVASAPDKKDGYIKVKAVFK